jgi:N-acetylneuraminate synthase
VELLQRVGVAAWKVASGELGNLPMFDRMAATGLPMLLSTGMSSLTEIDAAVARAQAAGADVAVLQCTSAYPCPPEKVGLNLVPALAARYGGPIGLSDHSGTIFAGLAAVTLAAELVEVHVTLSREMPGPDVPASVTTAELRQLVEGVRFIERMLETPIDKDAMANEMAPMRALFTRSLAPKTDLEAGTVLREEHLTAKKPGTGIPPARLPELVGRRLRRGLKADELLRESDLEPVE